MKVIATAATLRDVTETARCAGHRIAFVPTMGFLHDGHMALVARARASADIVVVSIYVNPTQFAPSEDLSTYPRDFDGDRRKLEAAGCDFLFQPDSFEIYPPGFSTFVAVEGITRLYEGEVRPDHFRGVATVVTKLLGIVRPHVVIFGQKDAQQVAVVRRLITDLDLGVELDVVTTVRDPDGLARSSRNVYLSDADRTRAIALYSALMLALEAAAAGASVEQVRILLNARLGSDVDSVDYADVVDSETFQPLASPTDRPALAIVAARLGTTRLIDNMELVFAAVPSIR